MKRKCILYIGLLLTVLLGALSGTGYAETSDLLLLPEALTAIADEAFYGTTSADWVVLPDTVQTIGRRAFANSSVRSINLPATVGSIADDAFEGCAGLVATVEEGSYALEWCERNNVEYRVYGRMESPAADFSYTVSGGAVTITGYLGDDELVVIPSTIEGCAVQAIGKEAFQNNGGIRRIVLPSTLLSIGHRAFRNCDALEEVVMQEGLTTVGRSAFYSCGSLRLADLPDSVTTLEYSVFEACVNLERFKYPAALTEVKEYASGTKLFDGCPKITHVEIPEGVTALPEYVFDHVTQLKTVKLPTTLQMIGGYAFRNCDALEEAVMPEGLTKVGRSAFYSCDSLRYADLPDSVTSLGYSVFQNCAKLERFHYPVSLTTVDDYATGTKLLDGCPLITHVDIPEGVTAIPAYTFNKVTQLKTVKLPATLQTIGGDAFSYTTLTEIGLPEGLTEISASAFRDCDALEEVVMPGSLTRVGSKAFLGCDSLRYADLPDSVTSLGYGVFQNCTKLERFKYPASLTEVDDYATGTCLLDGCPLITHVEIPEGVTAIPDYAFEKTTQLQSVSLPSTLQNVGSYAFRGCLALIGIDLPEGTAAIGQSAFSDCDSLTEIELPDGLTVVERYAFSGCDNLRRADLPDSVTTLGCFAFEDCVKLESFHYPRSLNRILSGTIDNIYFTPGILAGCPLITHVEVPNGVTHIERGAFAGCDMLKSVTLPETVSRIEKWAFSDCAALEKVYVPPRVDEIGEDAFNNSPNLTVHSEYGAYAIAYAKEQGLDYFYLSLTDYRLPGAKMYKGDAFALYGYVRSSVTVGEVAATIYSQDRSQVLQTVTVSPAKTDYSLGGEINAGLEFDKLELGSYVFELKASAGGETEYYASSAFTMVPPPLRTYISGSSVPNGLADPGMKLDGEIRANYPMTKLTITVQRPNGTVVAQASYAPDSLTFDLADAAADFDFSTLALREYDFSIVVEANGKTRTVAQTRFTPASYDGEMEEADFKAIVSFAANPVNEGIFGQYNGLICERAGEMDVDTIFALTVTNFDTILKDQFIDFCRNTLTGSDYDRYMVRIYKREILDILESLTKSGVSVSTDSEFITACAKSITTYGKLESGYIKEVYGKDISDEMETICEAINKNMTTLGYSSKVIQGSEYMANFILYLVEDSSEELAVLDVIAEMTADREDPSFRQALNEVRIEFAAKWVRVLSDFTNYTMDELVGSAIDDAAKLLLEKVGGSGTLYSIAKLVLDMALEFSGMDEEAEDVKRFMALQSCVGNADYAYRNAFGQVAGGDTSTEAVQKVLVSFLYARQAYHTMYLHMENTEDDVHKCNEIWEVRVKVEQTVIPGMDMAFAE